MRIATLQLDSTLGDVQGNIARAEKLLESLFDRRRCCEGESESEAESNADLDIDLLVLPELAFTGQYDLDYYLL